MTIRFTFHTLMTWATIAFIAGVVVGAKATLGGSSQSTSSGSTGTLVTGLLFGLVLGMVIAFMVLSRKDETIG